MGTHILNGGKGTTGLLLAMALLLLYEYGFILVCNLGLFVKSLKGSPASDC